MTVCQSCSGSLCCCKLIFNFSENSDWFIVKAGFGWESGIRHFRPMLSYPNSYTCKSIVCHQVLSISRSFWTSFFFFNLKISVKFSLILRYVKFSQMASSDIMPPLSLNCLSLYKTDLNVINVKFYNTAYGWGGGGRGGQECSFLIKNFD